MGHTSSTQATLSSGQITNIENSYIKRLTSTSMIGRRNETLDVQLQQCCLTIPRLWFQYIYHQEKYPTLQ